MRTADVKTEGGYEKALAQACHSGSRQSCMKGDAVDSPPLFSRTTGRWLG
jgi:hypothetical protein